MPIGRGRGGLSWMVVQGYEGKEGSVGVQVLWRPNEVADCPKHPLEGLCLSMGLRDSVLAGRRAAEQAPHWQTAAIVHLVSIYRVVQVMVAQVLTEMLPSTTANTATSNW
jgi:hypothetical protein